MHCWICDDYARDMSSSQRLQILRPFEIIKVDNEKEIDISDIFTKKNSLIADVISQICLKFFYIMNEEQDWL